jgi:L-threonylcarbamoyladenylate synthase
MTLRMADAHALECCLADGGVAVFPADTVYGLACDPESARAVARLYELKGRPADKPAAVMFFALEAALDALGDDLGPRTRGALAALLPGALTLLLPNPSRRFELACGPDPATLGLRVPALGPQLHVLGGVTVALLQSSANRAGGPDARTLDAVPQQIRAAADLVLDGGELPGTPSTVLDLRAFEDTRDWSIVRPGAVEESVIGTSLGSLA